MLNATDEILDFPGAYKLKDIRLISSDGIDYDITELVTKLNLFSSIYSPFVTGNIQFLDTKNIVDRLPLMGEETITFQFYTPSTEKVNHIDTTDFPMRVTRFYVQKQSEKAQSYIVEFASLEFKRNNRVRSVAPLRGAYSDMVNTILRNDLKTRKEIILEPTLFNQKWVSPNITPVDLIQRLADKSVSSKFESAGYLFYEDFHNTFHFRSHASLMYDAPGKPKETAYIFHDKPETENDILTQMTRVKSFELKRAFDHTKNTRSGMYASTLITHDIQDKRYYEDVFRYDTYFAETAHIEPQKNQNNLLAYRGIVDDDGKTLFDYSSSRVYLASKAGDHHNEYDASGNATYPYKDAPREFSLQKRISEIQSMQNVVLSLTIHGNTSLRPGMVIRFNYPHNASEETDEFRNLSELYSGRYVITKLRHIATAGEDTRHETMIECTKDSLRNPFPVNPTSHYIKPKMRSTGELNNDA